MSTKDSKDITYTQLVENIADTLKGYAFASHHIGSVFLRFGIDSHQVTSFNYVCSCKRTFDSGLDFKQHIAEVAIDFLQSDLEEWEWDLPNYPC